VNAGQTAAKAAPGGVIEWIEQRNHYIPQSSYDRDPPDNRTKRHRTRGTEMSAGGHARSQGPSPTELFETLSTCSVPASSHGQHSHPRHAARQADALQTTPPPWP